MYVQSMMQLQTTYSEVLLFLFINIDHIRSYLACIKIAIFTAVRSTAQMNYNLKRCNCQRGGTFLSFQEVSVHKCISCLPYLFLKKKQSYLRQPLPQPTNPHLSGYEYQNKYKVSHRFSKCVYGFFKNNPSEELILFHRVPICKMLKALQNYIHCSSPMCR